LAANESSQPAIGADGKMSMAESPCFAANDLSLREIGGHFFEIDAKPGLR
jgi:hypothetical protein